MSKKIYIAGKVSGLPIDEVVVKFNTKQRQLEALGHVAINPVTAVWYAQRTTPNPLPEGWSHEMRFCIRLMLECVELHMLPCWQDSKGAMLERDIAMRLGMTIVYC